MKWFRAEVNGEPVYFHAVTWYYARDIARRLWPLIAFEDVWSAMKEIDEAPPRGTKLQVYEVDPEYKGPRQAVGYEYDPVETAKPLKKKAVKKLTSPKKKKVVKASRKK